MNDTWEKFIAFLYKKIPAGKKPVLLIFKPKLGDQCGKIDRNFE